MPSPDARDREALVDAATGRVTTWAELRQQVSARADRWWSYGPGVALCLAPIATTTIVDYLSAMEAGWAVALLDAAIDDDMLAALVERYRPLAVLGADDDRATNLGLRPAPDGLALGNEPAPVHPCLAVLLATSGTTGNPKLVRLPRGAIVANATAIAEALGITADDRAPTSLPIHYSYGLSVVNSHLAAGATLIVTAASVMERSFWTALDDHRATSFAGVPYTYQMLKRLKVDLAAIPTLRYATQAGGKLADDLALDVHERLAAAGKRFHVMYGQTEATARMAVMPAGALPDHLGSAGVALPGGRFTVTDDGEVRYHGPNVMWGYADEAADLLRGDDLGGVLDTGDLGRVDADGYLWLTGRAKRIGKVFGVRVSLDDVETMLRHLGPVAAVSRGDQVVAFCEDLAPDRLAEERRDLAKRLKVHSSGVDLRTIERLPLSPNGKLDYRTLEAIA